ncbi:MAG: beta-galactosidase [Woeseiaceae bacterium]
MTDRPALGVCYYPEHWPEAQWSIDAADMAKHGISIVRVAEFAWSRIEPKANYFDWIWLDRAIDTLAAAGLNIVLGTPTACPPDWLIRAHPDILPVGEDGRPRQFGSRRHYSFSSRVYREHSRRITRLMAERYGQHPALVGWQTDNEYGCHDTTLCFSDSALQAFHHWLLRRYGDIQSLNKAWGNVFWSQEYTNFRSVGLPLAVTETNPAHRLAFRRFSSDQVSAFNKDQADILRQYSKPGVFLTHNFMGNFVDFDHYPIMETLDIASWDSYPLGFLDQGWFDEPTKNKHRRTGHPDWAAFHHDLYRGVGRGRFAVMEQQPGSVNWADNNAEPLSGMVRLWSHEAIAHGAEFVSWFRWRQAPFAQEQMHAGLMRPDLKPAAASAEVMQLAEDLNGVLDNADTQATVALIFDYEACWLTDIQPHRAGYSALQVAFEYYSAARSLGLDIDIVPSDADLTGYSLILLPCVPLVSAALTDQLVESDASVILGPRAGSKTTDCCIPDNLAPGRLQALIDLKVVSVDGIRSDNTYALAHDPDASASIWIETIESTLPPVWQTAEGRGVIWQQGKTCYVGARLNMHAMTTLVENIAEQSGMTTVRLPPTIRSRRRGNQCYWFNYSDAPVAAPIEGTIVWGQNPVPAAGVTLVSEDV